ncbi:MAG: hypothetical protein WDO73_32740 [Ignavibacteriota bacterium]
MIEATKLHPRTGLSLGLPPATIPYGALIEPVGSERDRERFKYLGELFECKHDLFVSATGAAASAAPVEEVPLPEPASEPVVEKAEAAPSNGPRLEWKRLHSSSSAIARAAIPGGWLVSLGSGITFVPDSTHEWDGGSIA